MVRREFSVKVKKAAYERCCRPIAMQYSDGPGIEQKPHCEECGARILYRCEFDHIVPDGLGGSNELSNCQVLCSKCHATKTHGQDRPIMAKADRQKKKAAGIKTTRNPIPGGKGSKWKRKLSGEVVER